MIRLIEDDEGHRKDFFTLFKVVPSVGSTQRTKMRKPQSRMTLCYLLPSKVSIFIQLTDAKNEKVISQMVDIHTELYEVTH